jgi:hypothetical protein
MALADIDDARSRQTRVRVIVIVESYLTLTLLGYFVGPLANPKPHPVTVGLLVIAYQVALAVGFMLSEGARASARGTRSRRQVGATLDGQPASRPSRSVNLRRPNVATSTASSQRLRAVPVPTLPKTVILLGALLSILFSVASLSSFADSSAPSAILAVLKESILHPGAAYSKNHENALLDGTLVTTLSTALSPFYYVAFPLGIYYFRRIPMSLRLLVVTDGILQAATAGIRGMNFGVFKVVLVLACVILLHVARHQKRHRFSRRARRAAWLGGFLFVLYFAANTTDRITRTLPSDLVGMSINYDSPVMALVPTGMQYSVVLLFTYLCQGYYGLSYALDLPFDSTYGMGSGRFISDNIEALTGNDVFSRTYVHRMNAIWSETENWHTAYTWFANDVSLWGVVPVMFVFGYVFHRVLSAALDGRSLGIALLPLFALAIIFLPANNVVVSNPLTCMPFVVLTAIFIINHIRPRGSADRPRPS